MLFNSILQKDIEVKEGFTGISKNDLALEKIMTEMKWNYNDQKIDLRFISRDIYFRIEKRDLLSVDMIRVQIYLVFNNSL